MNIELFYILSYCCICLPKYQDSNLERKLPTFTELPFTNLPTEKAANYTRKRACRVVETGALIDHIKLLHNY